MFTPFLIVVPLSPVTIEKFLKHFQRSSFQALLVRLAYVFEELPNWIDDFAIGAANLYMTSCVPQVSNPRERCRMYAAAAHSDNLMVNDSCDQIPNGRNMEGLENELEHSPPPQHNSRKRTRIDDPADQLREGDNIVDDGPSRPPKRRRSTTKINEDEDLQGQRRSPRQRRSRATSPYPTRPSKFAEGSMNDKPSKRPPSLYTRDEEAMEEYMAGPATSRPSITRPAQDTNNVYDAGIDQDKPSTMYRFGRAIANAFIPGAWTGRWSSKEPQVDPQQNILEAYAELKKTGFTGTRAATGMPMTGDIHSFQYDAVPSSSQTASFRDSAIDMEESRPSVENKENQLNNVMPAPSVPLVQRSVTLMPRVSSRRSSLNLHTPSLSTLKRVGSHLQLPSAKRHSAQESIRSATDSVNSVVDGQQIRKQPSKKDMLKQKRLYKRVSNLESQLEAARRELDELEATKEITHEGTTLPSIRPKPFMPGALPSLPSERLLKDLLPKNGINDGQSNILSTSEELPGLRLQSRYSMDHQYERRSLPIIFPNLPSARKRTSSQRTDNVLNPTGPGIKGDVDPIATTESAAKKLRGNPKIEETDTTTYSRQDTSNPASLKLPSRKRITATAPPVPPLPTPFHPSHVDKVKIMLMRPNADYQLPFGQSASDTINLKKAYPLITDTQIDDLLGKRLPDNKNVDVTSTTHFNHIASPTLSPPRSPSPKFKPSISKASLRSRSQKVPNNSPVSVRKTAQDVFAEITHQAAKEEEKDVVAPLTQSMEGKELPPYPRDPGMTVLSPVKDKDPNANLGLDSPSKVEKVLESPPKFEKGQTAVDKPLPGIQREEFEWDEDVF